MSSEPSFRPVYGQIIVRPIRKAFTEGGLIVPEKCRSDLGLPLARIVAIGTGRMTPEGENIASRYKVGQIVVPLGAPCPAGIDPASHDGTRGGFEWPMSESRKDEIAKEYGLDDDAKGKLTREKMYILFEEDIAVVVDNPEDLLVGTVEGLTAEELASHRETMEAVSKLTAPGGKGYAPPKILRS